MILFIYFLVKRFAKIILINMNMPIATQNLGCLTSTIPNEADVKFRLKSLYHLALEVSLLFRTKSPFQTIGIHG